MTGGIDLFDLIARLSGEKGKRWLLVGVMGVWLAAGCRQQPVQSYAPTASAPPAQATTPPLRPSGHSYLPVITQPLMIPTQLASLDWYHPTQVVVNPINENVYIINGFGSVYVSLTRGIERIANTRVEGFRISALALDQAHDLLYVGSVMEVNQKPVNRISIVQADRLIGAVDIPSSSVYDMAIDDRTNLVYVAGADPPHITGDEIAGYIYVLDKDEIIDTIHLGNHVPRQLYFDSPSGLLYVGGYRWVHDPTLGTIGHIDVIENLQLINQMELGQAVEGLILDPQSGDLFVDLAPAYINNEPQDNLGIFRDGELLATTSIEHYNGTIKMVHPHTNELVVSGTNDTWVYQRQPDNTFLLDREFQIKPGSHLRGIDPVSGNLYYVRFNHNETVVYHDSELLAAFSGGYPWQLGINPNNGWVYVSNTEGHTVSVLGYE